MFSKEKKEIKFRSIIELMGRPPEFLTETLTKTAEQLEKEEGIKVLSKEIFEPKETEEKDIFSSFIELELTVLSIEKLFEFILNYLPSNVEIIEPSEFSFQASEANGFINNVITRIHKMDAVTKKTGFENMILKRQLQEIFQSAIKVEENIEKPESKEEEAKEKVNNKSEKKEGPKKKSKK